MAANQTRSEPPFFQVRSGADPILNVGNDGLHHRQTAFVAIDTKWHTQPASSMHIPIHTDQHRPEGQWWTSANANVIRAVVDGKLGSHYANV